MSSSTANKSVLDALEKTKTKSEEKAQPPAQQEDQKPSEEAPDQGLKNETKPMEGGIDSQAKPAKEANSEQ